MSSNLSGQQTLSFWSCRVQEGAPVDCALAQDTMLLRVTSACLVAEPQSKLRTFVDVAYSHAKDKKTTLCCVSKGRSENVSLDAYFDRSVKFTVRGPETVSLTGCLIRAPQAGAPTAKSVAAPVKQSQLSRTSKPDSDTASESDSDAASESSSDGDSNSDSDDGGDRRSVSGARTDHGQVVSRKNLKRAADTRDWSDNGGKRKAIRRHKSPVEELKQVFAKCGKKRLSMRVLADTFTEIYGQGFANRHDQKLLKFLQRHSQHFTQNSSGLVQLTRS